MFVYPRRADEGVEAESQVISDDYGVGWEGIVVFLHCLVQVGYFDLHMRIAGCWS